MSVSSVLSIFTFVIENAARVSSRGGGTQDLPVRLWALGLVSVFVWRSEGGGRSGDGAGQWVEWEGRGDGAGEGEGGGVGTGREEMEDGLNNHAAKRRDDLRRPWDTHAYRHTSCKPDTYLPRGRMV
ncbi:hypothetical protein K438DRAFT_1779721 [Mycena galopus ATCC 62051]|nr:hypothetical protein K438DRAFT_1779721 [Mycena galopus ATCC 62051]